MSFTCAKHGWRHLLNACPACYEIFASAGSVMPDSLIGVRKYEYDKLKDERDRYQEVLEEIRQRLAMVRSGDLVNTYISTEVVNLIERTFADQADGRETKE